MLGAVFEPPALVAGLDDLAMMGEPVEERRRHLGVAKNTWPFAESEVRRDNDRGALIKAADKVKQELAANLSKGKIAELIKN